ncbi:MAG TPA: glycosyltransferase [Candidatus Acidoferrales bacterium]|nr:glycosyltransferase [Candidatus Acidoferrales bacterium]
MKPLPPASVVICSYEDASILEKSLAAFARQSFQDFEIVIADDGSKTDYAPILKSWAHRFRHGIQHVTHEKQGFRRARILNRGIHVSRFDRIIFLDMDCLPHRDFVRHHTSYLSPGTVITGRRVNLRAEEIPSAEKILSNGLGLSIFRLIRLRMRGRARVIEHGFVSPILYESSYKAIMGSNFSVCRSDLVAVNGFNEEFVGWGGEDDDLDQRLRFSGAHVRNLRNKVVQYHLVHPRRAFQNEPNRALLERTRRERTIRAPVGLAEIRERDSVLRRYGS